VKTINFEASKDFLFSFFFFMMKSIRHNKPIICHLQLHVKIINDKLHDNLYVTDYCEVKVNRGHL